MTAETTTVAHEALQILVLSEGPPYTSSTVPLTGRTVYSETDESVGLRWAEVVRELGIFTALEIHWYLVSRYTYVSREFQERFPGLQLLCREIILRIDYILRSIGAEAVKYVVDVYDIGEEEYAEPRPYIEVHLRTDSVESMLSIWEAVIESLRREFGDELLEHIDIFFTRAR